MMHAAKIASFESRCFAGYVVPTYCDSQIAKAIGYGADRKPATETRLRALDRVVMTGIGSKRAAAAALVDSADIAKGEADD
jgi:biotin carboxylase